MRRGHENEYEWDWATVKRIQHERGTLSWRRMIPGVYPKNHQHFSSTNLHLSNPKSRPSTINYV